MREKKRYQSGSALFAHWFELRVYVKYEPVARAHEPIYIPCADISVLWIVLLYKIQNFYSNNATGF